MVKEKHEPRPPEIRDATDTSHLLVWAENIAQEEPRLIFRGGLERLRLPVDLYPYLAADLLDAGLTTKKSTPDQEKSIDRKHQERRRLVLWCVYKYTHAHETNQAILQLSLLESGWPLSRSTTLRARLDEMLDMWSGSRGRLGKKKNVLSCLSHETMNEAYTPLLSNREKTAVYRNLPTFCV